MKKFLIIGLALMLTTGQDLNPKERAILPKKSIVERFAVEKLATQQAKTKDWWEPDTVYRYYREHYTRRIAERDIYIYNQQGYMKSHKIQFSMESNEWINEDRQIYTYDTQNNLVTVSIQTWESNEWGDHIRYTYAYNERNLVSELCQQYWANNEWNNIDRTTYAYGEQNNLRSELYQTWESNKWNDQSKSTCTYDEQNNLSAKLTQNQINSYWVNAKKYTYTYDERCNMLTEMHQIWEESSWKNSITYIHTYDEWSNPLTYLVQLWGINGNLVSNIRSTYMYDEQYNLSAYLEEYLTNDGWENMSKGEYEYSEQGNLLSCIEQSWADSKWRNDTKRNYTYNENGNGILGECWKWGSESWIESDFLSVAVLDLYYNNKQSFYSASHCYKIELSYINPAELTRIAEKAISGILIYPNPAIDHIAISAGESRLESVAVFNQLGQQVLQTTKQEIDISHLPVGVYILQIKTDKGATAKKVVKQ